MREFKPGTVDFQKYDKDDISAIYAEFKYRSDAVKHYTRKLKTKDGDRDVLLYCIDYYESCKWDLDRLAEERYHGTVPAWAMV